MSDLHENIQPHYTTYMMHNQLHNDNAPALLHQGIAEWYQHGQLHHENGPSIILPHGGEMWFHHGRMHRLHGPAWIIPGSPHPYTWYIDGIPYHRAEDYTNAMHAWIQQHGYSQHQSLMIYRHNTHQGIPTQPIASQDLTSPPINPSHILTLQIISDSAPVQIEGTFNDLPIFFRARGHRWTFNIGTTYINLPGYPIARNIWNIQGSHGHSTEKFAAGYLSPEQAIHYITQACYAYLRSHQIPGTIATTYTDIEHHPPVP